METCSPDAGAKRRNPGSLQALGCDWTRVTDDEAAFSESPSALVRWAPIVEELKQFDEGIVRNSVRFRWQEIRRDLRRCLDARAVLRGG
jgi:hypothetical protein